MCAPATAQSDTFTASTLHTSPLPQGISRLQARVRRRQPETKRAAPGRDVDEPVAGAGSDPGADLIRVPSGSDPERVEDRRESSVELPGVI